jgi:uncharacterized protein (TIGR03435 family)
MAISGETMPQFCGRLSTFLGRPVVDKTGLAGVYDLQLNFAQEAGEGEFPSMFTAVQEQLGLKLESARSPLEVLVIELIERPSGN